MKSRRVKKATGLSPKAKKKTLDLMSQWLMERWKMNLRSMIFKKKMRRA